MKKVELHLHLDGSCDVDLASKLEGRNVEKELIAFNTNSLAEYLERFSLPIKLLQDIDNIEQFSYLLGKKLEDDDVIYAEIRFCPLFHVEKYSINDVVEAILRGLKKVSTVKVNLIFCMMRHFSVDENKKIISLTKQFLGKGVVAIDLAGDEAGFNTANFKELFEEVKANNIPFTIHAGEAASYESVNTAIEFGAKRIGHGVRSIENADTINKLVSNKIYLEVCPISNIDTKVVSEMKYHPIKKLVEAGVLVTVNTDNRTVSNTNLSKEYSLLHQEFNFTDEDFLQFNLNAINCAFISDDEKESLRKQLLDD